MKQRTEPPAPRFVSRGAMDAVETAYRKMELLEGKPFEKAVLRFADCAEYIQRNFTVDAVSRGPVE